MQCNKSCLGWEREREREREKKQKKTHTFKIISEMWVDWWARRGVNTSLLFLPSAAPTWNLVLIEYFLKQFQLSHLFSGKKEKKKKKRKHFAFISGERNSLNFSCICKSALWKQFVQPVRFWGELYYVTRALDKTAGTGRDFDFPNCTTAMTGSAALTSLLLQNVQAWLGRAISPCIATSGWSNYQ